MEDELCEIADIAERLAKKLIRRGFSVAYVISGYDPISYDCRSVRASYGNFYEVVGATRAAVTAWERGESIDG